MDDSVIDPRNTRDYLRLCVEVIYKENIKGIRFDQQQFRKKIEN